MQTTQPGCLLSSCATVTFHAPAAAQGGQCTQGCSVTVSLSMGNVDACLGLKAMLPGEHCLKLQGRRTGCMHQLAERMGLAWSRGANPSECR